MQNTTKSDTVTFLTAEGLTFRIEESTWTPLGDYNLPARGYTAGVVTVAQVQDATPDSPAIPGTTKDFEFGPQRPRESGRGLTHARAREYVSSQFNAAKVKRLFAHA